MKLLAQQGGTWDGGLEGNKCLSCLPSSDLLLVSPPQRAREPGDEAPRRKHPWEGTEQGREGWRMEAGGGKRLNPAHLM